MRQQFQGAGPQVQCAFDEARYSKNSADSIQAVLPSKRNSGKPSPKRMNAPAMDAILLMDVFM